MDKDESSENQSKMDPARQIDLRVSGPLDLRLTAIDSEDRSFSPDRAGADAVSNADRTLCAELLENFGFQINLPGLEMNEQHCCSISIGEDPDAMVVTIELRAGGELSIYTVLETYPEGVSSELAARLELISATQKKEGYFLTASEHSVFLCASQLLAQITSTRLAEWVTDFYKEALEWRSRYRKAAEAPVVRISPSKGLKA